MYKHRLTGAALIAVVAFGVLLGLACSGNKSSPTAPDLSHTAPLRAEFKFSMESGDAPLTVQFTDGSSGTPVTWHWDFGDGTTSDQQSPSHTYTTNGHFPVTLIVGNGEKADTSETVTITAYKTLLISFMANPGAGPPPLSVTFSPLTYPMQFQQWHWDFGDGQTSTAKSPTHTYETEGSYTVTMIADGTPGPARHIATSPIIVGDCAGRDGPTAAFSRDTASGNPGLEIQFFDQTETPSESIEVVAWSWDFGDGSTASVPNPTHAYNDCGEYNVTLIVTDECGRCDTATMKSCVSISPTVTEVTFTPGSLDPLWAIRDDGDCDIGQDAWVDTEVELSTASDHRELWARIKFSLQNVEDFAQAEEWVKIYTAPQGWYIKEYPQIRYTESYRDGDNGYDTFEYPLATVKVKGATEGDDVCGTTLDDSHIIVTFDNITLTLSDCK